MELCILRKITKLSFFTLIILLNTSLPDNLWSRIQKVLIDLTAVLEEMQMKIPISNSKYSLEFVVCQHKL